MKPLTFPPLFLSAALLAGLLWAGCGLRGEEGSASPERSSPGEETTPVPQGPTESTAETEPQTATIPLRPVGGSGVEGEAVLEEITGGVEVTLRLENLPKPEAVYLAHIHEGTCGEEAEHDSDHGAEHEHARGGEIEHPLSMVGANRSGEGSSETILWDVGLEELLSGPPRYINVHAPGQGTPPALACGMMGEENHEEANR